MGSIMFSLLHIHTVCNRVRNNKKYRVSKLAKAKRIREYNKWTKSKNSSHQSKTGGYG